MYRWHFWYQLLLLRLIERRGGLCLVSLRFHLSLLLLGLHRLGALFGGLVVFDYFFGAGREVLVAVQHLLKFIDHVLIAFFFCFVLEDLIIESDDLLLFVFKVCLALFMCLTMLFVLSLD